MRAYRGAGLGENHGRVAGTCSHALRTRRYHSRFRNAWPWSRSREELLLRLELLAMNTAPTAAQFHGMLQMQHLVIHDVLHGIARNQG